MAKKYLNKSLQDRVKQMLMDNPNTREDNNAFMAAMWRNDIMNHPNLDIGDPMYVFIGMLSNGDLTGWDSATRAKRLLQEKHPELRGQSYAQRQKKTKQVKDELKNLKLETNKISQGIFGKNIF